MLIHVEVTQADIDQALMQWGELDPIEEAMSRAVGDRVRVFPPHWRVDGIIGVYRLPYGVTVKAMKFDKHGTMEPFSFDVELS